MASTAISSAECHSVSLSPSCSALHLLWQILPSQWISMEMYLAHAGPPINLTSPGGSCRWAECCRGPCTPCAADSKRWQPLFSAPQTSRYCQSSLPYVWKVLWFMWAPDISCKIPWLVQFRSMSQPYFFLTAQRSRGKSILAAQLSQDAGSGWQWPRGCGWAVSVSHRGFAVPGDSSGTLSVSQKLGLSWRLFDFPSESALVYCHKSSSNICGISFQTNTIL